LLSLTSSDSLQHSSILDFEEILSSTKEDQEQRPTLYDFLAHRALNFFKNTESSLTRPAEQFTLKGTKYFSQSSDFAKINTYSTDTMSNQLYYVKILQELTKCHLNDETPSAVVDVEIA